MNTLTIDRHADVPTALDLVKEEVGKEAKRILSAGGDALKEGKIGPAKQAIVYAKKLKDFAAKIEKLGKEWSKLQTRIRAASPDVREIVQPDVSDSVASEIAKPAAVKPAGGKTRKTGFTRQVESIAPKSNFTVTFPDGTVISDAKASVVLAKAIAKFGPARVAAMGFQNGGEPLVSQNRADFVKYPTNVVEASAGWYVNTHSGTERKIASVKRIAQALDVRIAVHAR